MSKIKILSKDVAEKIAAGEVVERAASVVKELIENSIDANARRISVEIVNKGVDLIKIVDDGDGMDKNDLELSIIRHATSKIANIDDLNTLYTMGFRGEALPSIACMSKLEIISRTKNSDLGSKLSTIGLENIHIDECGAPFGTQVIVKDLFYNTPARKKFLKSANTEYNYVYQVLENAALAYPHIAFKFIVDGKEKMDLPSVEKISDRIIAMFGKDFYEQFLYLDTNNDFIKISGYISRTNFADKKRGKQFLFVNNRPVVSKLVLGAINESYREYLMKGEYPMFFLFLEMSPSMFDVNVHPRKTEIKFISEQSLFGVIFQAINSVLREYKHALIKGEPVVEKSEKNIVSNNISSIKQKFNEPIQSNFLDKNQKQKLIQNLDLLYKQETNVKVLDEKYDFSNFKNKKIKESISLEKESVVKKEMIIDENKSNDIFVLAWLPTKYILAKNINNDLILIDQHAAHERINYEKFRREYKEKNVPSQGLLIPVIVELSHRETDILKSLDVVLRDLGFVIDEFGRNSFSVSSVPAVLADGHETAFIHEALSKFQDEKIDKISIDEHILDDIIMTACKYSIKANQILTKDEMDALVKNLFKTTNPYHCPHGRPTMIIYSQKELDKEFGRIK